MAIYEGVWYNHDSGKLVLTLDEAAAGFLSAAIVIFVNLVAASTWPILRYLLYLVRHTQSTPKDVFHHQRQIMLRNISSYTAATIQLVLMAIGWRKYNIRAGSRSIVYLVVCLAISVAWLVCGLYAPYIYTRTGSDVLLAPSPNCGGIASAIDIDPTDPANRRIFNKVQSNTFTTMNEADIYTQRCYGDVENNASCLKYPAQNLPFDLSKDVPCPFGSNGSACLTENSTVVTMDTGYLDSNHMFGINAKESDSVQYRRKTTCAPVISSPFVTFFNTSGTPAGASFNDALLERFWFGPFSGQNYTIEYNTIQYSLPLSYDVKAVEWVPGQDDPAEDFVVNSTLYDARDAGISIMFVESNGVVYPDPVLDPVFRAGLFDKDAISLSTGYTANVTWYSASYLVSPVVCRDQHQFCLGKSNETCTPFSAITSDLIDEVTKLQGVQIAQALTASRLSIAVTSAKLSNVVGSRGSNSLLAARTVNGYFQTAQLSEDHWVDEVKNWFSISLAALQAVALEYATGPDDPYFDAYLKTPAEDIQKSQCDRQRVRDAQGYVNYDMKGLIVLVVVGAALAFFGLIFETLMSYATRLNHRWKDSWAAWLADGIYHIHMTALESKGVKGWHDRNKVVPKSRDVVDGEEKPELPPRPEGEEQEKYLRQRGSETVSLMHTNKA